MKILLMGEYSNVHATLARGLKTLGHLAVVVSNGDFWKNYPRDISLVRHGGTWGSMAYTARLCSLLPRLRGFDIVQLINPLFLELKAAHVTPFYNYLKRHNRHVVLGAFGMDYYWVNECTTNSPLRYSDFNIGHHIRQNTDAVRERQDWLGTDKERLNKRIALECDGIVAGLYEYWACYERHFAEKTIFIPYPIQTTPRPARPTSGRLRLFIGINRQRSEYKGTDIMLRAAEDMAHEYPGNIELVKAESVPFEQYQQLMEGSDAILDQLYSYTPSMNALLAMSKGIVNIGGGEPENYTILQEDKLRPIVNVEPNYDSVRAAIGQLLANPERVDRLKEESMAYVSKHHDYLKVARQYEEFYLQLLG